VCTNLLQIASVAESRCGAVEVAKSLRRDMHSVRPRASSDCKAVRKVKRRSTAASRSHERRGSKVTLETVVVLEDYAQQYGDDGEGCA